MYTKSTPLTNYSSNGRVSNKPAETQISIQSEFGTEVRVFKMSSGSDGIVEIEVQDNSERIPFQYSRN